ncbi:V-type ATPase subunit, partial [Acinetobacter baumannii]
YYEDLKALADAISSPFVKGYVTTLIDSANLRAAVRCVRMGKDAEFLRGALVAGGNVPVQRLVQAVFSGEGIAAAFAATPFRDAAALGAA